MLLSIVTTGRNDDYGGDFAARIFAALGRNQAEAKRAGVSVEWLFVEWNPPDADYLSYELAPRGCTCFVVDPRWHEKLIAPGRTFSRGFAKNVGIRRAMGDWILSTNPDVVFSEQVWSNIAAGLDPRFLHRAERCDVDWRLFGKPFEVLRENIVARHVPVESGGGFTTAAGDFLLFPARDRFGYDEAINSIDIHTDGRFCENWSALMSDGRLRNPDVFRFLGDIFKADHPNLYIRTVKRFKGWDYRVRTCEGPALFENEPNWGLGDVEARELKNGIWYLDFEE